MSKLHQVLRMQDALTRLGAARQLLDQAWPELIGNRPECSKGLYDLYTSMSWLQEKGQSYFVEAVEQMRAGDLATPSDSKVSGNNPPSA